MIGGNVSITNNDTSLFLFVQQNTIGKNMAISNNSGPTIVSRNTVTGNLECSGNTPTSKFTGSPNTVMGKVTGQCGK